MLDGLAQGDLDAGIARDAEPPDGLVATPLYAEPFVAVLPATHRCAGRADVSVGELADEPFVSPPRAAGARAFEKPPAICEQHGFRPRVAHEATHWLTILRLVGAGLGVALAPACVRTVGSAEVACVPLDGTAVRSDVALLHREGDERPMVSAFARLAVAVGG